MKSKEQRKVELNMSILECLIILKRMKRKYGMDGVQHFVHQNEERTKVLKVALKQFLTKEPKGETNERD